MDERRPTRFDEHLVVRVPAALRDATELEAERRMTTTSEVIRQAIVESLGLADGKEDDVDEAQKR